MEPVLSLRTRLPEVRRAAGGAVVEAAACASRSDGSGLLLTARVLRLASIGGEAPAERLRSVILRVGVSPFGAVAAGVLYRVVRVSAHGSITRTVISQLGN